VTNAWLVLYTWLQHTAEDVPHFGEDQWTWEKGAFMTIDRPYGPVFDFLHHRIGSTHVAHHLNHQVRGCSTPHVTSPGAAATPLARSKRPNSQNMISLRAHDGGGETRSRTTTPRRPRRPSRRRSLSCTCTTPLLCGRPRCVWLPSACAWSRIRTDCGCSSSPSWRSLPRRVWIRWRRVLQCVIEGGIPTTDRVTRRFSH
jgi:hypothetical protein